MFYIAVFLFNVKTCPQRKESYFLKHKLPIGGKNSFIFFPWWKLKALFPFICNGLFLMSAGITGVSTCHEKRGLNEAPGKSAKTSGNKVCPYSHPSAQNSSGSSAGNALSTSADLCKTTPKHFKTMCRRPTPPGNYSSTSSGAFIKASKEENSSFKSKCAAFKLRVCNRHPNRMI